MSDTDRAFPTSKAMLDAGEREVQAGINMGTGARTIANACYQTMRRIRNPVGRPRIISEEKRAEMLAELKAGVSSYAVRKKHGVGNSLIEQLRKELLGE